MSGNGRICKRCGDFATNFRQIEAVENPGQESEEFTVLGDLCPVCLNRLKKWMKGGFDKVR